MLSLKLYEMEQKVGKNIRPPTLQIDFNDKIGNLNPLKLGQPNPELTKKGKPRRTRQPNRQSKRMLKSKARKARILIPHSSILTEADRLNRAKQYANIANFDNIQYVDDNLDSKENRPMVQKIYTILKKITLNIESASFNQKLMSDTYELLNIIETNAYKFDLSLINNLLMSLDELTALLDDEDIKLAVGRDAQKINLIELIKKLVKRMADIVKKMNNNLRESAFIRKTILEKYIAELSKKPIDLSYIERRADMQRLKDRADTEDRDVLRSAVKGLASPPMRARKPAVKFTSPLPTSSYPEPRTSEFMSADPIPATMPIRVAGEPTSKKALTFDPSEYRVDVIPPAGKTAPTPVEDFPALTPAIGKKGKKKKGKKGKVAEEPARPPMVFDPKDLPPPPEVVSDLKDIDKDIEKAVVDGGDAGLIDIDKDIAVAVEEGEAAEGKGDETTPTFGGATETKLDDIDEEMEAAMATTGSTRVNIVGAWDKALATIKNDFQYPDEGDNELIIRYVKNFGRRSQTTELSNLPIYKSSKNKYILQTDLGWRGVKVGLFTPNMFIKLINDYAQQITLSFSVRSKKTINFNVIFSNNDDIEYGINKEKLDDIYYVLTGDVFDSDLSIGAQIVLVEKEIKAFIDGLPNSLSNYGPRRIKATIFNISTDEI